MREKRTLITSGSEPLDSVVTLAVPSEKLSISLLKSYWSAENVFAERETFFTVTVISAAEPRPSRPGVEEPTDRR